MITIYTQKGCAPCKQAIKFLDHKQVPINVIDITEDDRMRKEIATKANAWTVPILTDGEKYVVGYKPAKIMELIHG